MIIKTPQKGILPKDGDSAEGVTCEVFEITTGSIGRKQINPTGTTVVAFNFATNKLSGGRLFVVDVNGVILHPLGG
jgi:hypothetical protein